MSFMLILLDMVTNMFIKWDKWKLVKYSCLQIYNIVCWQIGGLATSINSSCVRCGCLDECTIRLWYAPFLTAIAFRTIGSVWGPTSGIKVEVTGLNPRDVAKGRLLADQKIGCVHQLPLCLSWVLGRMHYKVRVCAFPNSSCF